MKAKAKFYCFGNPLLDEDKLPLELMPSLSKKFPEINFVKAETPDEIEDEKEINIIDTVKGIERVTAIRNIEDICIGRKCSLHDFDLGMTLKIMKKLGKVRRVLILGVPPKYAKRKALSEMSALISKLRAGKGAFRS